MEREMTVGINFTVKNKVTNIETLFFSFNFKIEFMKYLSVMGIEFCCSGSISDKFIIEC